MYKGFEKIVLIYFCVGLAWIYLSDKLVLFLFSDSELLSMELVNTIKGFSFIGVTTLMLYQLIKSYFKALKKSEEQYREIFDANPHPMWIFNPKTLKFLKVNQAAINKYGYNREEF